MATSSNVVFSDPQCIMTVRHVLMECSDGAQWRKNISGRRDAVAWLCVCVCVCVWGGGGGGMSPIQTMGPPHWPPIWLLIAHNKCDGEKIIAMPSSCPPPPPPTFGHPKIKTQLRHWRDVVESVRFHPTSGESRNIIRGRMVLCLVLHVWIQFVTRKH